MTTRQYRKRIELGRLSFVKATILMGILTLTSCAPQHFVMMSHQAVLHPTGEIWLQWSEFERGQYVAAYAEGMNEGFRHGCETALEATMPPEKGERFLVKYRVADNSSENATEAKTPHEAPLSFFPH